MKCIYLSILLIICLDAKKSLHLTFAYMGIGRLFILPNIRSYSLPHAFIKRETVLTPTFLSSSADTPDEKNKDEDNDQREKSFSELQYNINKLRLEQQNTKRFLTAGPRFLPYKHCREWVVAWGGRWQNEKDWKDWIFEGEKRNSYIPARPDEYYTNRGEWISWDHFLGVVNDNDDCDCESTTEEDENQNSNTTSYFSYFQ